MWPTISTRYLMNTVKIQSEKFYKMDIDNNNFSRGSEWRKWDLHIHTPETAKNNQYGSGEEIWNSYVSRLETNSEFAVLGITDYFSIDNYSHLLQMQKEGRLANKTLIPNIELRLLPVTQDYIPINIHVLFDPGLTAEVIKREFLQCMKFPYKGNEYSCLTQDLIALGRAYKDDNFLVEDVAKNEGISQFNISYDSLSKILNKKSLKDKVIVAVSNSNKDGNSGIKHSSLAATRQEIYRMSDIIFSGNEKDISYFLGEGVDNESIIIANYGSLKPCITGSDAHSMDKVNVFSDNKFTWIKADPTFEGLRQILYEPKERVKIQENDPTYEYEKFPFTKISIPQLTNVFSKDEDIKFDPLELPLNSNLVSIIGGRGTGKSQLINYLASAFNDKIQNGKYNFKTNIIISHAASLSEEATPFNVSEMPNVPFMYIAQSQIKELVTDKKRFSANILETIGVTDIYTIPYLYTEKAENVINEYFRIANYLNADDSTIQEKKDKINKEIKRYTDLIQSITSEQNRLKLEGYKTKVQQLHSLKDWEQKVTQQIETNDKFVEETNSTLNSWNEKFKNIEIPLIDISSTQTYLKTVFLQKISDASRTLTQDIENTKNEFSDYKGDLTTLLSNVSLFQTKLSELQNEKEQIEKEENNYKTISTVSFKTLGKSIKDDITAYTKLIQTKWETFKGETDDITSDKKTLLAFLIQPRTVR